jgi:hypothetical protein
MAEHGCPESALDLGILEHKEVEFVKTGGYYMNLWVETMDEIGAILEGEKNLTVDQRIAIAQARAMLSITQELSSLIRKTSPDAQASTSVG